MTKLRGQTEIELPSSPGAFVGVWNGSEPGFTDKVGSEHEAKTSLIFDGPSLVFGCSSGLGFMDEGLTANKR